MATVVRTFVCKYENRYFYKFSPNSDEVVFVEIKKNQNLLPFIFTYDNKKYELKSSEKCNCEILEEHCKNKSENKIIYINFKRYTFTYLNIN